MVEVWWSLVGTAIPAVIAGQAIRMKKRRGEEQRLKSEGGREKSGDEIFVCERVCTSKRMLKKVGSFSKDRTPDTCVTVCGVSELDACTDACARTVCVNQHQVPNWNDICLRRKGRTKALEGIDMHNLVSSSRRRPTIPAEIVAYSGDSEDRDDDKEEVDEEQDEEEDGDANKNEEDEEDRDDDSDQSSQLYLWTRMRVHSNYYVHDCMKESITWPYCYGFER